MMTDTHSPVSLPLHLMQPLIIPLLSTIVTIIIATSRLRGEVKQVVKIHSPKVHCGALDSSTDVLGLLQVDSPQQCLLYTLMLARIVFSPCY